MHEMQSTAPERGIAQERQVDPAMRGSDSQQPVQHEAFRLRQGNSSPQTTQGACRTIRAVSRPNAVSVSSTGRTL